MSKKIKVTVWNEFLHEKENEAVKKLYPEGIHKFIADRLIKENDIECRLASLNEPEHGLTEELLHDTDVLIWWGHKAHNEVDDEIVKRVHKHVVSGMGLIVLHSGHFSKIFKAVTGTTCALKWREAAEKERLWNIAPAHPITEGIGEYFEIANTEMYGERFDIPEPDELIFISWFEGGEVFRSGVTYKRGNGKVFYFRPGHETYPVYYNDKVIKVIKNAVRWTRKTVYLEAEAPCVEPLEKIDDKNSEFGSSGIIQDVF
ncbi:MAG TPA: ThuA domain-containing protein [Victivallales bacterium]|nr:ThuA domain-containing protein [Victivallales bacterium]